MNLKIDWKNKKNQIIAASIVIVIVILSLLTVFIVNQVNEGEEKDAEIEQLKLQNEQKDLLNSLTREFDVLDGQFKNYENRNEEIKQDTIFKKYLEAKDRAEKLMVELRTHKITSEKKIRELTQEVSELKGIMRHYIAQIDTLTKENKELKAENKELTTEKKKLSTQVNQVSKQKAELQERMTLAEKLNITGVSLTPLKKNGKREKKIKKAKQLMVTFTIPQNNSTPVGEKMVYVRITTPEGTLLEGDGTFEFEEMTVPYTACKRIEYTGEELPGIQVYWDVNMTLTTGQYIVEIFADNYRIASRQFMIEK